MFLMENNLFTATFSKNDKITKTIKEWLEELKDIDCKNSVIEINHKNVSASGKEIYNLFENKIPLTSFIKRSKDIKIAIKGAISYYLMEAKANTHLTHLEELILTQGEEGYFQARSLLLELIKNLKGHSDTKVSTSVKWDGAPAIITGINPENGRFFVGTKSVFNAKPLINYTKEDIINNHSKAEKNNNGEFIKDANGNIKHGGLVDKLMRAIVELPKIGITKILQGDFMFDDGMLKVTEIDGESNYIFKPNTITYAVPVNSELGEKIGNAKFGIVFHTTYDDLYSAAKLDADVSDLKKSPDVWFDDARFTDDTGYVTLTNDEEAEVKDLIRKSDSIEIDYENLPLSLLNIYINSEIRTGNFLEDPYKSFEKFKDWYQTKIDKSIEKVKRQETKERKRLVGEKKLEEFEAQKQNIINIFEVSKLLSQAKNIFVIKYNNAVYNTKHFVDDGAGGLKVTNPEGYVAVDYIGNGVKLVDRLEFSRANFAAGEGFKNESKEDFISEFINKEDFINEVIDVLLENTAKPRKIILYPGRFQPMGKHHAAVFAKLQEDFGDNNVYILTSDKVELPNSPLNFDQKKKVMSMYKIPPKQILKLTNLYGKRDLEEHFNPLDTIAIYTIGFKDMQKNPRFSNLDGVKENGEPAYMKSYKENLDNLQTFDKSGYVMVANNVSIDIPKFGEMCGTSIRSCLKSIDKEAFIRLFGWFDKDLYITLTGRNPDSSTSLSETIFSIIEEILQENSSNKIKNNIEEYRTIPYGTGTPVPNPNYSKKKIIIEPEEEEEEENQDPVNDSEDFEFEELEEISAGGIAGYSLPIGMKSNNIKSKRPEVAGINFYNGKKKK